jgi:hypothetical protein
VAVQSKVVSSPSNETEASFDYWCDAGDLEYWLKNNIPVALIISKPSSDEAYWIPIQQYFGDVSRRGSMRISFKEAEQRVVQHPAWHLRPAPTWEIETCSCSSWTVTETSTIPRTAPTPVCSADSFSGTVMSVPLPSREHLDDAEHLYARRRRVAPEGD